MSDDIVARLVRWHTAMANEPKRAESKRTKHRETIDLIWRLQADLSDARKSADFWKAEYLAGNYLIEQQATRIKELERDAERLDWMDKSAFTAYRERDPEYGELYDFATVVNEDRKGGRVGEVFKTIREAIDAARRK